MSKREKNILTKVDGVVGGGSPTVKVRSVIHMCPIVSSTYLTECGSVL